MSSIERPVVDVHAHAIIGAVEAVVQDRVELAELRALEARRNGAESLAISGAMVRDRLPKLTDLGQRLADMDAIGVDVQVVSPSPSQYHYWAPPDLARQLWTTVHDALRDLVAAAPTRLRGLGLAPLQHPDLCVEALDHAWDQGLRGVEISSFAQGFGDARTVELSDPRLEPFWARAAELGAVVFLHPFGCSLDERLDQFYLSNTVGQPVENAVALSHLIFSGVLDRHPDLKLVAAHGGGYLPFYLGRSDHAWQVRPEARRCLRPPSEYLSGIWFDSLVHTPRELQTLVDAAGASQVLLGSDYPFDMGVDSASLRVREARLDPVVEHSIVYDNVQALAGSLGLVSGGSV